MIRFILLSNLSAVKNHQKPNEAFSHNYWVPPELRCEMMIWFQIRLKLTMIVDKSDRKKLIINLFDSVQITNINLFVKNTKNRLDFYFYILVVYQYSILMKISG